MIRLGTMVLGAENVDRAVTFWAAALGYDPHSFDDSANDFTILMPPSGQGARLAVQYSETPAQDRPRVHLDLVVADAKEQQTEVDRLITLGATQPSWDYPKQDDFIVLADTEGNRFCVVDESYG